MRGTQGFLTPRPFALHRGPYAKLVVRRKLFLAVVAGEPPLNRPAHPRSRALTKSAVVADKVIEAHCLQPTITKVSFASWPNRKRLAQLLQS